MNKQPIECMDYHDDGSLDVQEIFYSIQGEGPFIGRPAVFVRLSGCNLCCPFCDTKHELGDMTSPKEILNAVRSVTKGVQGAELPLLVVTGGEPFKQAIGPLLALSADNGYTVQVETNGTLAPSNVPTPILEKIFIVCSPKAGHPINITLGKYVNIYKLLVEKQTQEAEIIPYILTQHPVYLQPIDGENIEVNLKRTLELCKRYNLGFSPQLQKLIGGR